MRSGDLAAALGKGLAAGVFGTAAMTVSSTVEAKVRERDASTAPADAASKVLGVQPTSDDEAARFSNVVHWLYGAALGGLRGILSVVGLPPAAAAVVHLGTVWGGGLVMLPALGVAPPVSEWGTTELAIDGLHHSVYALGTTLAYSYLDAHTSGR